ncbi:hypothetical protein ACSTD2_18950 [Vibrio vulnificus]|uniref:hypothetical protein n=1 Tax=Vibrio vulnificus TaxID=672 RepID=UPI001F036146|nr:hypothetical protein [Vibrio vulnificus]MCG9651443.1 hypothetical protein [Vibrio vulnificus]
MKTELEQARGLHDEAVEMLRQSRQMHDLTISNQSVLVYALSSLLPKHMVQMVTVKANCYDQPDNAAEQLADNARCVLEAIEKREVYDIVHAIHVLAIANTDVIHVFTEFAPHANSFTVNVLEGTQHYNTGEKFTFLLQELVFLNDKKALESLLAIESQVTELIIEAREQAEAKAEVEA